MQDDQHTKRLAQLCVEAQKTFDDLVKNYRAASDAAQAAEAARTQASAELQASFDEVVTLAAAVRANGLRVPVQIEEVGIWRAINRGRERGEILTALEACAPKSMRG